MHKSEMLLKRVLAESNVKRVLAESHFVGYMPPRRGGVSVAVIVYHPEIVGFLRNQKSFRRLLDGGCSESSHFK